MADLVEIFSSVQGEGPEVGASTLFVRFGGCDLRCRWCDSPHTWRPGAECRFERARGSGVFDVVANPVSVEEAVAAAEKLEVSAHRFVSLTGGEPLLQPEAAGALAAALGRRGPAIHLETHGAAPPERLDPLLPHLAVVSMDWKLASDVHRAGAPATARGAPFHDAHQAFLARARHCGRVVVKLVVTPASEDGELDEAFARIAATAPEACVVLQPVTPTGAVKSRPPATRLLALAARAQERLADVRVIPQTHPVFGAL